MTEAVPIETVAGAAWRRIRTDILTGRLPPGQKLKLETLRADYGVSVSTLREILGRLSSERLVVAEGQRGFEVMPISVENLREVAALRVLLECHALEHAFLAGDVDWESRVVSAHHRLAATERRMAAGDRTAVLDWKRADWQFHQALIAACGSRLLISAHASVFDKYLRYQMIALSFRGDVATGEHARLLAAALDRDAETACALLRSHVEGGVEHALASGTIR